MYALLIIIVGIISPLYLIYKPPTLLIHYFQRRWPDILWLAPPSSSSSTTNKTTIKTNKKPIIALTIDDGPSPYTSEILQILKANDATATFFLIGSNITDKNTNTKTGTGTVTETLHNLIHAGNELANHAMHDEPSWRLSDAELITQIKSVERKIQHIYHSAYDGKATTKTIPTTNNHEDDDIPSPLPPPPLPRAAAAAAATTEPPKPPRYFRPGSGFFTTRMRRALAALDYKLVLGSVYPHDAQIPFSRVNAHHVLDMVKPGAIVICHDGRSWTAPMLRLVLPELRRRGYRVVTVTELLREYR
ncbi:hypothetical protein GX50_07492 [[Emmonsia] crescens]|uniref:chitin deacetylase n=1 Tax=[Emmonsia] crescens TaxID=73230 RepID=A0A2B7Z845_9EURO|nr:hypothetical protein GX50_07492 [Emmonsia crescens]